MEIIKEKMLTGYPNTITYECTKKIIEQMENNICKIKIGEVQGTGFFCTIPFPNKNKKLNVMMTNNHVINDKLLYDYNSKIEINIKKENKPKEIDLSDRLKYTNIEYDITIIEIKEKDNIKNFLELDDYIKNDILENNNNNYYQYIDKTIYIIQFPEGELSVSYGVLNNIYEDKKYNFTHKCSTKAGSSGSPILNLNNKIIGIHKEGTRQKVNIGSFLSYPIKEFIKYETFLKDFNKKYNLNIRDTMIDKLDLSFKNLGNELLEDLCKIEFQDLKELDLCGNDISDIKILEKAKFKKLEIIFLGNNKLTDINILEKVHFEKLKELNLNDNIISDISVLEKVKFEKLEKLNLSCNGISDINVLEKVNFKELKILNLFDNNISDIEVLGKVKFPNLEILYLNKNKIDTIKYSKILSQLNSKIKDFKSGKSSYFSWINPFPKIFGS